ncbi:MerR family transcriptional regulator [Clostridium botulinum]|uniref:MerR family transcriptional regulator n=1 Tax=Clostridium botulinum TaxID=1491 RepID=UPI000774CE51|nr:MerR family transcriptional regulator [Clostridium botulinum]
MLKIGEFSKLTKVSVRMLHYYDDIGLLKPMLTDKITGYRLYSVSQVPTLQKIIMLRDLNFQTPEIENALNNWSEETLIEKLNMKIQEKQDNILKEKQQIKNLEMAIESVNKKQIDLHYNIIIREVPSQWVISLRKTIPNYNYEGVLWEELFNHIKNNHIDISKQNDNNIAIYYDTEHKDIDVDVEVCLLVKRIGKCSEPFQYKKLDSVDTMACMMVRGNYGNLNNAYQSFLYWLEEHPQYKMNGLSRQICHRDHTNEENEDDYLTEIQIPVEISSD